MRAKRSKGRERLNKRMTMLAGLLSTALLLGGCTTAGTQDNTGSASQTRPTTTEEVQNIVDSMSLEEKVAQLFLVQPEAQSPN